MKLVIYDVTGTDDPFDAENDDELTDIEKQILDKKAKKHCKGIKAILIK